MYTTQNQDEDKPSQKILMAKDSKEVSITPINAREERIQIHASNGMDITFEYIADSNCNKVVISMSKIEDSMTKDKKSMEIDFDANSVCFNTPMDLKIRANNIEIEADDTLKLKSKSELSIKGALIKLN